MKILVAAFEPFDGRARNRAERAARRLADVAELAILPVSFARLPSAIDALLARAPDVLILCGEARAAKALRVERIALNLADARIRDNDGAQPRGLPLDPAGPLARAVRFRVEDVVAAIDAAGVLVEASAHAGTFCCNAALYHALAAAPPSTKIAFIHVPARRRRMRARVAAAGLRAAVAALSCTVGPMS